MNCEARMWDLPLHCVPVGKASTRSLGPGSMTAPVLRSLHFEAWLEKVLSQQPGYKVLTKAKARQF